jgi:hypothetical protein
MTNWYVDLNQLFNFKFNYITQRDIPGVGLDVFKPDITVEQLQCQKPIAKDQVNVFDFSQNFADPYFLLRLSQVCDRSQINHVILGPDPGLETDTICYFPTFYLSGLRRWQDHRSLVFDHEKIYKISCLNRGAHGHRIQNFLRLIEKNYDFTLYSWLDMPGDGTMAAPDIMEKYQQLRKQGSIPIVLDAKILNGPEIHNIQHDAYQASYVNIITETMVRDTIFISEKTWKSVASGQLFFIVGSLGTIQHLRDLGVDVFDDIIDHSYDLESDWVVRIDRMHDSLAQLMQQDLSKLYEQTRDRRLYNQERFFSGQFGMHYVDRINLKFSKGNQL